MLKLDPDDADSDDEVRDKLKLNSNIKSDLSPNTSAVPSTTVFQALQENENATDNSVHTLTPGRNEKTEIYPPADLIKVLVIIFSYTLFLYIHYGVILFYEN